MYKTTFETQKVVEELITAELNEERNSMHIYIRGVVDGSIVSEATIDITPDAFYDLVYPLLQEKGFNTVTPPKVV